MTLEAFLKTYGHTPAPPPTPMDGLGAVDVSRIKGGSASRTAGLFGGKARVTGKHLVMISGLPTLNFGRFKGRPLTEVAGTSDGLRYLTEFVLPGEFPEDLKGVVRRYIPNPT